MYMESTTVGVLVVVVAVEEESLIQLGCGMVMAMSSDLKATL